MPIDRSFDLAERALTNTANSAATIHPLCSELVDFSRGAHWPAVRRMIETTDTPRVSQLYAERIRSFSDKAATAIPALVSGVNSPRMPFR
jgi:hypothetical protein